MAGKRENNSHIDCGCPREKKIPVLELEFIKAQRTKAEGQGSMQMGSIDYSETKKQIANAKKREQIREREQKKKMKSEEAIQREEELCQDTYRQHLDDIEEIRTFSQVDVMRKRRFNVRRDPCQFYNEKEFIQRYRASKDSTRTAYSQRQDFVTVCRPDSAFH
ncbi:hypothetical protein Hamer_G000019 [Homarus americanus]|uniref:Uncharacterized protein n=1 Tax=Homarus americanus TaxID=6706 RepID=A0A8J5TKB9_HOMAM|nr:hypothetical protein Hamer_G000019 [Homarus americanus]